MGQRVDSLTISLALICRGSLGSLNVGEARYEFVRVAFAVRKWSCLIDMLCQQSPNPSGLSSAVSYAKRLNSPIPNTDAYHHLHQVI